MKIKVLAEARGSYRKAFLDEMIRQSEGDIELALHFGDKNSDFDAPSLNRQEIKKAKSGRIITTANYAGANLQLINSEFFNSSAKRFADQIHRSSPKYQKRSHKMLNLHEYIDYYHILSDTIAEQILDREVTHAIFFDIPHLAVDTIIYDVAKSMGIKTIILTQFFPNKIFSTEKIEDFGDVRLKLDNAPLYPLDRRGENTPSYMDAAWQEVGSRGNLTAKHKFNFLFYLLLNHPSALLNWHFIRQVLTKMNTIVSKFPEWRNPFDRFFDQSYLDYLEYLSDYEGRSVNFDQPYIYVPLHLQPEMTTSALGGIYCDQLLMIEHLHNILPDGWKILVKENPKQGPFARGAMFFHRLNRLDRVQMVPSDTNTSSLAKNSQIVATVTGTAAWEAIQLGKPAITFGRAWFNSIPGIMKFDAQMDLIEVSKTVIDPLAVSKAAGALFERCHLGNIDKGFFSQVEKFDKIRNAQNVGKLLNELLKEDANFTFDGKIEI